MRRQCFPSQYGMMAAESYPAFDCVLCLSPLFPLRPLPFVEPRGESRRVAEIAGVLHGDMSLHTRHRAEGRVGHRLERPLTARSVSRQSRH